jgi:hypothetical protein
MGRWVVIRDPARPGSLETGTTTAVHQVTGLKTLGSQADQARVGRALMAEMRRKTLIVCAPCHDRIHANLSTTRHKSLEIQCAETVSAGLGGRLPGKAGIRRRAVNPTDTSGNT